MVGPSLRVMKAACALCAVLCVVPTLAQAQSWWFLESHGYFDPVLAEPRAAQTTVLFPARADSFPFAVNEGASTVWDINLGHEIPIIGFSTKLGAETPSGVAGKSFGFGVWFPLSFHMIEDMGKDPSNPILNTDYRFSGLVKAQWGLADEAGFWSSAHVGGKLQFGHESTHIGDEFTLGALQHHFDEFERVNVSYEYFDVAGSFEPNIGTDGRYQLKVRAGTIWLWRPARGWYNRQLLQPFGRFIAGSERNQEPYVQFELYRQPAPMKHLGVIASVDLRNRTVYQYTPAATATETNTSEPAEWSINLMTGVRQVRSGTGLLGKITPTYYFRYYRGVNPNGQFRNQSKFNELGIGVHFGF